MTKAEKKFRCLIRDTDVWKDNFAWSEDKISIIAKSEMGQITIDLLELNRARILQIRLADVAVKRHPPEEDLS